MHHYLQDNPRAIQNEVNSSGKVTPPLIQMIKLQSGGAYIVLIEIAYLGQKESYVRFRRIGRLGAPGLSAFF